MVQDRAMLTMADQ